jgi:carboxypeptidase family protein
MSRWRFLLSAILVCTPILLWAQDTGSITGTIEDPTRAVIPGVQIAARDTAKGIIRTTISNGDGDYLLAGLPAGTYDIALSATGFQPHEVKSVILAVAQKLRVDAVLQVGSAKTEFTVSGEQVPEVETEASGVSGVVTGREISQLELNGRNFTQLITLVPGVGNTTGQDEGTVGAYGNVAYIMRSR